MIVPSFARTRMQMMRLEALKSHIMKYPKFLFKLDLHIADSSLHSLGPREAKVLTTLKHLIARCRTGPSDVYIGK